MSGWQEPGNILAVVTVVLGVVWQIWDRLGKGRADTYARTEAERDRLEKRVQSMEERLDTVEAELEELKRAHNVLLDFLRDIKGDYFSTIEAIKKRAHDLLERFGGSE